MQPDSGKVRDHKQLFYKQSPMWLNPGTSLNKDKLSDQYTTKNKTEIAHSLYQQFAFCTKGDSTNRVTNTTNWKLMSWNFTNSVHEPNLYFAF